MPSDDNNVIPFPGRLEPGPEPPPGPPTKDTAALARELVDAMLAEGRTPREILDSLMGAVPGAALGSTDRPKPGPQPQPFDVPDEASTYTLRLDLDGAKPPIWRRIEVASDLTLDRVHDVVQAAMGWWDTHLHHFRMGPGTQDLALEPFLTDFDLSEGDADGLPESEVRLDQVMGEAGDRLYYLYDFGDGWGHTLRLEKVRPRGAEEPVARCLAGRRACPPEDAGGIHAYNDLVELLARPDLDRSEDQQGQLDWLPLDFDPGAFEVDRADAALAAVTARRPDPGSWLARNPALLDLVDRLGEQGTRILDELVTAAHLESPPPTPLERAEAMRPLLVLLEVVGDDGAELTGAGYLRPAVVERLFGELGLGEHWIGKGNREELTPPVAELRGTGQRLGLVRRFRGRLVRTPAGRRLAGDAEGLWHHVVERLPLGSDPIRQHAGVVALLCVAGEMEASRVFSQYAAGLLEAAGWRLANGDEVEASDAFAWAGPTWEALRTLRRGPRSGLRLRDPEPAHVAALARDALRRP
jgi:hypothetical protein